MISLTLTVCLLTAPSDCRRERLDFDGPLFACAIHGQQAAAEWVAQHPKWMVRRWSCGPSEREV